MVTSSIKKHGGLIATTNPVEAAEQAMEMTESVVIQATDWGLTAAFALMGTVTFFCLITFLFRRL